MNFVWGCGQGNLVVDIQEKVPSREHFLLPNLGPKLEALREEVRIGRGFQILRCGCQSTRDVDGRLYMLRHTLSAWHHMMFTRICHWCSL